MDKQEIYDVVKAHLLAQGKKSVDPLTHCCLYRGPGGLKCAIGVLIPDELYDSEIEATSVFNLLIQHPKIAMAILGYSPRSWDTALRFLKDLQVVHDRHDSPEWPAQMAEVAKYWELEDR